METRIARWGSTLAVRLPAHLASEAGLAEGTSVELTVDATGLRVRRIEQAVPLLADLLSRVTDDNRHEELLVGPSMGSEPW